MKPGSVIVDLTVEAGGNCEVTVVRQRTVTSNGVTVLGDTVQSNNIVKLMGELGH
jgi:NAD/NADP transhydrogenase alpha subunit